MFFAYFRSPDVGKKAAERSDHPRCRYLAPRTVSLALGIPERYALLIDSDSVTLPTLRVSVSAKHRSLRFVYAAIAS